MTDGIGRRIQQWGGLAVVSRFDARTDSFWFIALHDDTLGSPVGGTRIKIYPKPEDGLEDAQRLAEGMTNKWAAIDLPYGGGKAVLALSRELTDDERVGLIERFADLLNTLRGTFSTGQDLGTTLEDIRRMSERSPYVHGPDRRTGRVRDPGPYTARGVFAGICAASRSVFGSPGLMGKKILIEGFGGVGVPLAKLCANAGASLKIADQDASRAQRGADKIGGVAVACADVIGTPCDIYAPCAIGATLNAESIPRLNCRIVAGSANNQLAISEDAERLHRRDILYAPDYLINGGGALGFGLRNLGETDEEAILERIDGLGVTLDEIFEEARERSESPVHAATRRTRRVLAAAAKGRAGPSGRGPE